MPKPKDKIDSYFSQLAQYSSVKPELFNDVYSCGIDRDPIEYIDSTERWNADRIMILMMVIHHHLQSFDPESYSLVLVGSDARREKAPHSEFEFCIITDNGEVAKSIQQTLLVHSCSSKEAFSEHPSHRIPTCDNLIEIKNLQQVAQDTNYLISGFNGSPEHIWPDRVLHSQLVWGNPEILISAKKRVLEEFRTVPKLTSRLARQGKDFVHTVETGISRRKGSLQTHFSLEDEKVFFKPDEYILGLKYSVIRLIQNILLTSQIQSQEVMDDGNTLYLLEQLFSKIHTLYQDVVHSYSRSLQIYHLQQQNYYETQSYTQATISVPQTELLELLQPALALFKEGKSQKRK